MSDRIRGGRTLPADFGVQYAVRFYLTRVIVLGMLALIAVLLPALIVFFNDRTRGLAAGSTLLVVLALVALRVTRRNRWASRQRPNGLVGYFRRLELNLQVTAVARAPSVSRSRLRPLRARRRRSGSDASTWRELLRLLPALLAAVAAVIRRII